MRAFIRVSSTTMLGLALTPSISAGCGGSEEAHGADASLDSATESTDAADCGEAAGTVEVIVAAPVSLDYCDWEISVGSEYTEVASGIANFTPTSSTFTVACLGPSGTYYVSCTCPYSELGPCTGGEFFSTSGPGATTQVLVDVSCPG